MMRRGREPSAMQLSPAALDLFFSRFSFDFVFPLYSRIAHERTPLPHTSDDPEHAHMQSKQVDDDDDDFWLIFDL
jgi:hypothetical protein